METQKPLLKDEDGKEVDVHLHRLMIGQVLLIQNQLLDYGYNFMHTKIYIDNKSTICIVKNPVFHSKTKHIEIRHHFIRDSNEKKLIQMIKIHTDKNVADLLTKAFDATVKVKTVNGEQQLQALMDGKNIIITEATVRRDLQLEDANGIDCLPNAIIFEQLTLMGFVQVFFNNQLEGMATHNRIYIAPSHTKKIFANMRRQGKYFSGRVTPLFPTMVVQAQEEMGEDEAVTEEPSMKLKELMDFCTKLQQRVLDLENTKTAQAQEITSLKKRVKKLEKKRGSRTHKLKILYMVGRSARVVSSEEASLGDQEDTSKQGRKTDDINVDEDITLKNVHDADMFRVNDLDGDEVVGESEVTDKASEKRNVVEEAVVVTNAITIPVSAATITNVELNLA
ncbi:hypothetical protein Tco_1432082 [Tanacetum coccineum]